MNTSDSAGNDQERNNNRRKLLRWNRRRYRDRIWCLSPDTWLALGFFLLVMGLSLLNTGYCFASDADRDQVMKFGAFVLCSGWAILIFLVERIKSRNWCRRLYLHNPRPKFVGVCIGPPIQPEFLSAMLIPEIEREWVPAETLPGFEPRHAEIVYPPTQQATTGVESRSKRRRNRKKKVKNSVSELDSASQESNETIVLIATIDANQEDGQSRDLVLRSNAMEQESEQEYNKPNLDTAQQGLQESSQPTESNFEGENINKVICQDKDQVRNHSQTGNNQPSSRLNDTINEDNSSTLDKVVEENPASDHHHKASLQTANGLMSEESYLESVKTTMNLITGEDQQEKLELALLSPDRNYVDDSSEQLNKTPGHWRNMTMPESEKPADQTISTNTTSSEMQQVVSKPVAPDFITFTSKKRNKRRKKLPSVN